MSWQSTCNGIGQVLGVYIGNNVFIILESSNFSNQYIRPVFGLDKQLDGIINLKSN